MTSQVLLIDGGAGWARSAVERFAVHRPALAVERCRSAIDALRAAERRPVALAVASLVLPRPGCGGASTLARLRELYPSCRTALVTRQEALRLLLTGAADELLRPSDLERWLDAAVDGIDSGGGVDQSTIADPKPPSDPLFKARRLPMEERLIGGKYRPVRRVGRGGMGEVWRAEDTFIQRPVALKWMQAPTTSDPEEIRQRMRREVVIAGRLSHPNFVTVYDAGLEGRDVYLVMELVEGPTLAEALKTGGAIEPARAVALTQQILGALSQAHRLGFIHRDLKPSNVLMAGPDLVKVTDFGLAKLFRAGEAPTPRLLEKDLTLPEYAVGTPHYMAPEQLRCEPVDARTDLYAVGLLLFEMVHGTSLSHYLKPLARARAVSEPAFDKPIPVLPGEQELQKVLEKSLSVHVDRRFQDAESFASALDEARSSWQQHRPRLFPFRGRQ